MFESPPFRPEDETRPHGGELDEDEEESFHILPVDHKGDQNSASKADDEWSPADMAKIDGEEMDDLPLTQGTDEDFKEITNTAEQGETETDVEAEKEHDSEEGLTAPEEMAPSNVPASFDTDPDASSTEVCENPYDETLQLIQYAIVIDAGSTGSRIHVYKFNNCGPTPALEYETFKAIQPGLSSFARDPTAAAASLDPLMEEAVRVVPKSLQKCTPVEVKATAGLRLLPGKEGEDILDEVRVRLESDWPFAVAKEDNAIEIMDGKDEGVYAWITANYLLGNIGAGATADDTMAVMDLGGASTQIVFEPTFPDKSSTLAEGDHKYSLNFGGKDYTLYQHSYLGYGLMRARRSVHNLVAFSWSFLQSDVAWDDLTAEVEVNNPCLSKGMDRRVVLDPAGRKAVNVTMTGKESSFESCKRVVELVLAKDA
jgi:guanosine-diphosphatase